MTRMILAFGLSLSLSALAQSQPDPCKPGDPAPTSNPAFPYSGSNANTSNSQLFPYSGGGAPSANPANPANPTTGCPETPANTNPFPNGNGGNNNPFAYANSTPPAVAPPTTTPKEGKSLAPGILYGSAGVLGVVGIAATGVAVSLKIQTRQVTLLSSEQTPNPSQVEDLVSSTRTVALVADASLGLAVTSAVSGYLISSRAKKRAAR